MQYNTWKMLPETHICVCCNYKIQVPLIKAHIRSFSYHRNLSLKLLHFSTIITSFVYTNHASTASRTKQNWILVLAIVTCKLKGTHSPPGLIFPICGTGTLFLVAMKMIHTQWYINTDVLEKIPAIC